MAPHGSIPYPGRHGYRGHLSQRVPADQTGVYPDDVSSRRLLLGTFVQHNAQVLVTASENQQECKNLVLMSQSELVCVSVCVLMFVVVARFFFSFFENRCFLRKKHFVAHRCIKLLLQDLELSLGLILE